MYNQTKEEKAAENYNRLQPLIEILETQDGTEALEWMKENCQRFYLDECVEQKKLEDNRKKEHATNYAWTMMVVIAGTLITMIESSDLLRVLNQSGPAPFIFYFIIGVAVVSFGVAFFGGLVGMVKLLLESFYDYVYPNNKKRKIILYTLSLLAIVASASMLFII